ncbi:nucleotidyltransferase substrate binding protein [Rhodomicrobium vannielii ATCC 17100]|uniref:HI0074 family nucleotidyltransferase substrate-binding subunit n=1 Tax=Rhodomicrobium vannielii TaxID=1069 RepID=UPI001918C068|nr:HI0074 family nucleotidyltransferase substrate-binding subunit [Rhodomicrobium vannielii]MBJ7532957.1 nucleotidyltransferase substrate binding protein [Rhodomicrobium vannielii ATCC 17100]
MLLELEPLRKAIAQLEAALDFLHSDLPKREPQLKVHLQAATIQAFEFVYELTYKMLRRFLTATEPNAAEMEKMSFQSIIRLAFDRGLVEAELAQWLVFREYRGTTSHTYDENKAAKVLLAIPAFLKEAQFVFAELQRRQA